MVHGSRRKVQGSRVQRFKEQGPGFRGSKVKGDLDFSVLVLLNRFIIEGQEN
jgi:hypothetical protein